MTDYYSTIDCDECGGFGRVDADECEHCRGHGFVREYRGPDTTEEARGEK